MHWSGCEGVGDGSWKNDGLDSNMILIRGEEIFMFMFVFVGTCSGAQVQYEVRMILADILQ